MNKIHRNGVDIQIAFESGFKRMTPSPTQTDQRENMPYRNKIKSILRRFAQYIYHVLKPLLQPVAGRLRAYLIGGLRQDLQQEIQRASNATVREIQRASDALIPRLDRIESYSYATARRVAVNCGAEEVMVRTEVGFVLCSPTDYLLLACLIDSGELELGTRLLIQKILKPDDVYVDVGANIGMHVLAAAKAMQGKGKIIAFEPYGPTKKMLEKSVWINGFSDITEIHEAAVSNVAVQQKLYLGSTSGHHSLFDLGEAAGLSKDVVDVQLVRLDGILSAEQKIDLLKIDVEGAELEVVESAAPFIAANHDIALIVEFGPSHLRRIGHTSKQWFEAFAQYDLCYQVINSLTGELEDWAWEEIEAVESINIFFAHRNSSAWLKCN